jgi:hypothetical protein
MAVTGVSVVEEPTYWTDVMMRRLGTVRLYVDSHALLCREE